MFRTLCYIFMCLVSFLVVGSNTSSVPFVKPCKPNDQQCIVSSAKAALPHITAGIPSLGLPPIESVLIDSVRTDGVDLKLGFRNIKITGVTKCQIIEAGRNPAKNTMKLTVECPLTGVGQYDVKGKIAFLEVFGDGDFKINTDKVRITVEIKIKDIEKKGRKHWKITSFDYSYEMIEKVYFDLKNLFNGDDKRAKPIRDVLDHSWKELIEEIGGPLIQQVLGKYVDIVQKFFLAVPKDDLELSA